MKRLLPIFICFLYFFVTLFLSPGLAFAQSLQQTPTDSRWVIDPEVTFIGKNARRSGDFLDWTLQNYNWVCVKPPANGTGPCDNSNNPIEKYWSLIVLYIVVPMLFVVILATSVVIIVTRGKSLTVMRFIPRFIAVVLLIVFSYSLLQFFYQFTDLIQGFFLRSNINQPCPPNCISDKDLLYVGWDYTNFVGLRLLGDKYAESAFISLLLTKLTALTYFVMVFLLLVRRIILWFFIIVSPIFPILLLYYPVRNTGKIWIGEFFRWLLYAPLFAIFLNGLVYLWRNQIPLNFLNPNIGNAAAIEYPTAVNILLGGPRQQVTPTNSVNLVETFALYVVSLIMLWIVILLPWILLQIFLDYAQNFAPGDTAVMKTLVNMATSPRGGGGGSGPQPAEGGGGAAISLPFAKKFSIPTSLQPGPTGAAKELKIDNASVSTATFKQPAFIPTAAINSASVNASVLNAANVKLPSMRDIARFDIALNSADQSKQQEVSRFSEQLVKLATPIVVTNTVERERVKEVRERIVQQSQRGNLQASSLLNAANSATKSKFQASTSDVKKVLSQIANPASTTSTTSREKLAKLHDTLQKQSKESNNQLASSLLSVNERTSASDVEKIREKLNQAAGRGDKTASSVLSTVNNESQKAQNLSQTQSILKQIANPASITNATDRETMTKLHDSLQKESKENHSQLANSLLSVNEKTSASEVEKIRDQLSQAASRGDKSASSVLSTINSATQKSQASQQTRNIFKQIANPASVTNPVERESFTRLHEALQKESKENNNSLASSILQVTDSTSVTELDKIREQLMQTKENTVMQSVNNMVQQNQSTTHVKSVLQEVANPDTAKVVNKEKVNKLHETLQKASTQGNQLASSILKVNERTTPAEIEALQQKIEEAKVKGEPLATELSDLAQGPAATLPKLNRVQTVKKEDFQAVKDMWKQNYQNLEVPQGMAGNRSDWIKDDIASIDETIALLTSPDADKQQQGMDQVSNLLPFLLVGGFSQEEIVGYLKAKQDAAKEVSTTLSSEEETKVSVTTHATHAAQTMAATVTENPSTSSTASSVSSSSSEENEGSPLTNSQNVSNVTTNYTQPEISNEILNMVNVKIPRLADIARFETQTIKKDTTKIAEVEKAKTVLEKIANPTKITDTTERTKFEQVREKLLAEQQKGNPTAAHLLNAAARAEGKSTDQTKAVLSQIANPSLVTRETDKERFAKLHESLQKASKDGNQLATAILSTKDTTTPDEIEKLQGKIQEAKAKGEAVATSVLPDLASPTLPDKNDLQPAGKEDFDEVEKMWEENYRTLPVPADYANDRLAWIKADTKYIEETIGLLQAPDTEKQQEGQKRVSDILPMLLLGGFSNEEVIGYLKAKLTAGQTVLPQLTLEEESKVTVGETTGEKKQEQVQQAEEKPEEKK